MGDPGNMLDIVNIIHYIYKYICTQYSVYSIIICYTQYIACIYIVII